MNSDIGISIVYISFVESQSDQGEIYKETINTLMKNESISYSFLFLVYCLFRWTST